MECLNKGVWHLGISDEACENAGGKWIRTPCVTLKETIDDRPSRFDLENPMVGTCQEKMQRLHTSWVSASTGHQDFPFNSSCVEFCQSLPDYGLQTGMMIRDQRSDVRDCTCIYPNDKSPSRELMPKYATPSPPVFTLTNSNGLALGLQPKLSCDSATDLTIEAQVSDPKSARQQFKLTQDGRVVSEYCPDKVLSIVMDDHRLCTAGVSLKVSSPIFANDNAELQSWIFDEKENSIFNARCPSLAISSIKKKSVSINSIYFALQNQRTQLAIGIEKMATDECTNGMHLQMQEMEYGSSHQKFIYDEDSKQIFSVMCSNYALAVPDGDCASGNGLVLSSTDYVDKRNEWLFDDVIGVIKSVKCKGKFITIDGVLGGRTRTVKSISKAELKESSLPGNPEPYDDEKASKTTNYTHIEHTEKSWEAAAPAATGSAVALSDRNEERYQKWEKQHQVCGLNASHIVPVWHPHPTSHKFCYPLTCIT